jgi:uncharacterized protein with PQ loop repeat
MSTNFLYFVGGFLWAIEMIPQIRKTYRRKTVGDISVWFPVICIISFICVFIAHIELKRWVLLLSQTPPLICNLIFLFQVLIYRRNRETDRLSEKTMESNSDVEQVGNA